MAGPLARSLIFVILALVVLSSVPSCAGLSDFSLQEPVAPHAENVQAYQAAGADRLRRLAAVLTATSSPTRAPTAKPTVTRSRAPTSLARATSAVPVALTARATPAAPAASTARATSAAPAAASVARATSAALAATTAAPAATTAGPAASSPAPAASYNPGNQWMRLFGDEFDGTQVDASKWTLAEGGGVGALGESQLQAFTPANAEVTDGNLVITADPDYKSARLTSYSKFSQQNGLFAARVKLPRGRGVSARFFLLGNNYPLVDWPASGEIDVVELDGGVIGLVNSYGPEIDGNKNVRSNVWYKASNGAAAVLSSGNFAPLPQGEIFADAFHVFEVEWAATNLTFRMDGAPYWFTSTDGVDGFAAPFFVGFEVALTRPQDVSVLPQSLVVDWVRAYQPVGAPPGQIDFPMPLPMLEDWPVMLDNLISYDMIDASSLDLVPVSGSGAPTVTTALRVTVSNTSTRQSDAGLSWITIGNALQTDALELSFWIRPVSTTALKLRVVFEGVKLPIATSLQKDVTVPGTAAWTQVTFPVTPLAPYNAGKAGVRFEFLFAVQTFDIAALTLTNNHSGTGPALPP